MQTLQSKRHTCVPFIIPIHHLQQQTVHLSKRSDRVQRICQKKNRKEEHGSKVHLSKTLTGKREAARENMFRYVVNGPGRYDVVHSLFRSWNRRQQGDLVTPASFTNPISARIAFVSQSTNGIVHRQISVIWYDVHDGAGVGGGGLCKVSLLVTVAQIWPRSTRERISDNFLSQPRYENRRELFSPVPACSRCQLT